MRSGTSFFRIVKTAAIVMMMKIIAMVIVVMITYAGIRSPPTRPVVPIPRRVPASPVRTPEPIVNNRSVDIYRFYHIVRTIDIFIADNLYRDIVGLIFFHIYTGHVLVNVLSQNSKKQRLLRRIFRIVVRPLNASRYLKISIQS